MDMIKIGQFLTTLRKEKGLTQEQLGEQLGVTNKTISRWETGTYLPPVEMLQIMAELYSVSINEILCGERLNEDLYKETAEKNLTQTLSNSVFVIKGKQVHFEKEWKQQHWLELTLEMLVLIAALILCGIFIHELCFVISIICIIWAIWIHNRMAKYVEHQIYDQPNSEANKNSNQN